MSLTLKAVERAMQRPGRYGDERGLYLDVKSVTNASWVFRFERGGRERWMGLGSAADFTLPEARERARKARQQLADGIDPIEARKSEKARLAQEAAKALTFAEAAPRYYEEHAHRWSNAKHAAQWDATMREYVLPKLGKLSVATIDTGLVLDMLKQLVAARGRHPSGMFYKARPETAGRVRQRAEAVLDWCIANGFRTAENPARREVVKAGLPDRATKAVHFASMPYPQVPQFMADLHEQEGIGARALEFTVLTWKRTNEVLAATWDEIDFNDKIWNIPGERMKAREAHRVPLSDAAIELLRALPRERGNNFVFIGPRRANLSGAAMAAVLKRMGITDATVHGFRSSARTWGEERTAFPHIVLEMALAHHVDDKVVRTYRRTDLIEKRRRLMSDWARYCLAPAVSGEVVPVRMQAAE